MSIKTKANNTQKELVEQKALEGKYYSNGVVYINACAHWKKISFNCSVTCSGGQTKVKIATLPDGCYFETSDGDREWILGVFNLMTSAWVPTEKTALVTVKYNEIYVRTSESVTNMILYCEGMNYNLHVPSGE